MVVRQEAREEIKFVYAKAKGGITQEREQTERLAWMLGCGGEKTLQCLLVVVGMS